VSWQFRSDPSGWTTRRWDWSLEPTAEIDPRVRNTTAADQLWIKAQRYPDKAALRFDDGTSLTFGEIAAQVRSLAAAMQGMGLQRGDRVSAQLPNWPEFIVISLASCALGLVMNPIIPI
jgi:acyl-CoA synthetase (AMP-forming)/AMP-acid ligase II